MLLKRRFNGGRGAAFALRVDAGPLRKLALLAALAAGPLAAMGALGACDDQGSGGDDDDGEGGAGGCPMVAAATFTISVHAPRGPVPLDTVIRVAWSAATEPPFALADPTTWKTLDDANIVCAVDRAKPPPLDLPAIVCELWTSGATRVEVSAKGYAPYERTLTPTLSEACEGVLPQEVDIELVDDDGAE